MKQIIEDYVSYEIAKLLKEKGFDEICSYIWGIPAINKGYVLQKWIITNRQIKNSDLIEGAYTAPSQSLALKWLREVHNLHITIKPYITEDGNMYLFEIYKLEAEKFTLIKTKTGFEKSELANEAALKYTLENLI